MLLTLTLASSLNLTTTAPHAWPTHPRLLRQHSSHDLPAPSRQSRAALPGEAATTSVRPCRRRRRRRTIQTHSVLFASATRRIRRRAAGKGGRLLRLVGSLPLPSLLWCGVTVVWWLGLTTTTIRLGKKCVYSSLDLHSRCLHCPFAFSARPGRESVRAEDKQRRVGWTGWVGCVTWSKFFLHFTPDRRTGSHLEWRS